MGKNQLLLHTFCNLQKKEHSHRNIKQSKAPYNVVKIHLERAGRRIVERCLSLQTKIAFEKLVGKHTVACQVGQLLSSLGNMENIHFKFLNLNIFISTWSYFDSVAAAGRQFIGTCYYGNHGSNFTSAALKWQAKSILYFRIMCVGNVYINI